LQHIHAETDEAKQIAAVWIKRKADRGPRLFDPKKHIFDTRVTTVFSGASEKSILSWIALRTAK
jgi:hypothetical protein